MAEPTEHHLDERVVLGPIHTPFSYAYIAACNQSEITFPQNVGGHEVALPHLLNPECQEAVPWQADVLAEHTLQYLIPKESHWADQLSTNFILTTFIYNNAHRHGVGMLCIQAGGRCVLS